MSVQDRKLAGIKAAKEKMAQNKLYGGAADPRVRKRGSVAGTGSEVGGAAKREKGEPDEMKRGKPEVNGAG